VLVLAPRPGRLVGEVPIALPRPRERQSAALAECRQRTLALLDHAASDNPADIAGPVASGSATKQETTSDTTPSPINYHFAV
jgi:hypothetical protein